jgi:aminoglycoside/choline kinase family phosphotransferase
MLLTDLGQQTMIELLTREPPGRLRWYQQATDALLDWQKASRPGVLPRTTKPCCARAGAVPRLVPGQAPRRDADRQAAGHAGQRLQPHRGAQPGRAQRVRAPRLHAAQPDGAVQEGGPLGVLDFQDAVYGPITYDIASLMRDAFISWDEEFVIDITVRYWEKARKAGCCQRQRLGRDFGEFYRAVEWMGLQRHLKVAGIFARLTLRDGKPKYLADAPRFMHYIRATANRYRELTPLLRLVDEIEGTQAATGFAFGRM